MSDKVTLTLDVTYTKAMQILAMLTGEELPVNGVVVNNNVDVDEANEAIQKACDDQAAEELAEEEEVAENEPEPEEEPEEEEPEEEPEEEAEEAPEEEPEEVEEEPEEEEPAEDEEPEADEDEAPEYTLTDIREALAPFMASYKTQAAGKKALGEILGNLPHPAKCLSDVKEADYKALMEAVKVDDDPLA